MEDFEFSMFFYIFAAKVINFYFMFKIIACINQKRALGKDGKLLYTIKNDLANFKRMTVGNVIIMGRKTFESLPNGEPLKDRINIILTSNEEYGVSQDFDNVYIVHSVKDVIELCEAFFSDKELFVIGGEALYRQFMDGDLVDELRLTVVKDDEEGDVTFPEFNEDEWSTYYKSMAQVSSWEGVDKSFYFHVLKRKK
jgi:dihydrofolate reductase